MLSISAIIERKLWKNKWVWDNGAMIQTGENRRIGRETFVTATFSNIKPIRTGLASNPDILGEITATDFL